MALKDWIEKQKENARERKIKRLEEQKERVNAELENLFELNKKEAERKRLAIEKAKEESKNIMREALKSVIDMEDFSKIKQRQIQMGIDSGLEAYQIFMYAKPGFSVEQMKIIRRGLEYGLSEKQINVYAKKEFEPEQMIEMMVGLVNGFSVEQVQLYADPRMEPWQMQGIRLGFEYGLSIERLKPCANFKFGITPPDGSRVKEAYDDWGNLNPVGLLPFREDEKKVRMKNLRINLGPYQEMYAQDFLIEGDGRWTVKQIERFDERDFEPEPHTYISPSRFVEMNRLLHEDPELIETAEKIPGYHDLRTDQKIEVLRGLQSGLTQEEISIYAKEAYYHTEMKQIRRGMEMGLSKETMESIAEHPVSRYDQLIIRNMQYLVEKDDPVVDRYLEEHILDVLFKEPEQKPLQNWKEKVENTKAKAEAARQAMRASAEKDAPVMEERGEER